MTDALNCLMLPGDGIGPEIIESAETVLQRLISIYELPVQISHGVIGLKALAQTGTTMPPDVEQCMRAADMIVLGPLDTMAYVPDEGGINVSAFCRTELGMFANLRPCVSLNSSALKSMDLLIVREASEGFYADRNMYRGLGEMQLTEDVAISVRKITRQQSERIARIAFEAARERRSHVTAVHKANNFRITDGLFLEAARAVATEFPDVILSDQLVDSMAALLVRQPEVFDVILTTNLFGDILSDLASELSGSLGIGGGLLAGTHQCAAQAQHGSAPDIAGTGRANPLSILRSLALMLEWISINRGIDQCKHASIVLETAIRTLVVDRLILTPDLGGTASCQEVTSAILSSLSELRETSE